MIDPRDAVNNITHPLTWLMGVIVGRFWWDVPLWAMVVLAVILLVTGFVVDIYIKPYLPGIRSRT